MKTTKNESYRATRLAAVAALEQDLRASTDRYRAHNDELEARIGRARTPGAGKSEPPGSLAPELRVAEMAAEVRAILRPRSTRWVGAR